MSEYQYYEFQAIDRPLNKQEMEALRELSTRAQITSSSFVNTYNYGNFRGDPMALVEKYFDAFLYISNWGTHQFMIRIPRRLLDAEKAENYCICRGTAIHVKEGYLILEFQSEAEDYDWVDGEGLLSSLISLRSDIIHGDYRCLYLAWLYCAQIGELDDDDIEPPVPPNLGNLNASLNSFIEFMRINIDLVDAAAEKSIAEDKTSRYQKELSSWIRQLPDTEKNDFLLRLIDENNLHLGVELVQRFQETLPVEDSQNTGNKPRLVGELLACAETCAKERKRKIAEEREKERLRLEREKAIAREKRLTELASHENEAWEKVETYIETKQQSGYDEAVKLLVDLRDVARKKEKVAKFEKRLQNLRTQYSRKSSFIRRLKNAGLG